MLSDRLSEREQQVLAHLQQAQALGVSLREYADAYGQDVKDLYNGKAQLVRKGVIGGKGNEEDRCEFLPVQVAAEHSAKVSSEVGCRISHLSGWSIECTALPDAVWLATILNAALRA